MPSKDRSRGLTLIELMVAIAVLSFVSMIGWRGLDAIARSRQVLNEELAQTRGLQLAFAQLQIDCANAVDASVLGGVPALQLEAERITLVRRLHREAQPSALQLVTWRWQDGALTREEAPATRDLNQLYRHWQQARTGSTLAVRLQSQVQQISLRVWADDGRGWRVWQQMGAPAAARTASTTGETGSAAAQAAWRGIEVTLQLAGRSSNLTKMFMLGAP